MIAVMLLMIAGGIALSQAVSCPKQVTLHWLRLGGIIAVTLTAVAAAILIVTDAGKFGASFWTLLVLAGAAFTAQLMTVQLARRHAQRLFAAAGYVLAVLAAICAAQPAVQATTVQQLDLYVAMPGAVGLVGGFVMTMLIGHAYLTAGGQMTQAPFQRLVLMLAVLLILRAATSLGLGLYPYLGRTEETASMDVMWNTVMLTARYLVGLAVPAVFTAMIHACVRQRANQSATGILYVAGVLVIIGEGIVLGLIDATGWVF